MNRGARLSKIFTLDIYFEWLCDLVRTTRPFFSHLKLMNILHSTSFKWYVPNDDNRAFEGKNLREKFCDDMGFEYVHEYYPEECSMLELMIGLAYRCESIMADQNGNIQMYEWFEKMLDNVGLSNCTDESFLKEWDEHVVKDVLEKIIERKYNSKGEGGLFPLKHAKEDQRKVELWYQMSTYLLENYYTEDMIV